MTIHQVFEQHKPLDQLYREQQITGREYASLRSELLTVCALAAAGMIASNPDSAAEKCLQVGLDACRRRLGTMHSFLPSDFADELQRLADRGELTSKSKYAAEVAMVVDRSLVPYRGLDVNDLLGEGKTLDARLADGEIDQDEYDRVRANVIFDLALCYKRGFDEDRASPDIMRTACQNQFAAMVGTSSPMTNEEFERDLRIVMK